jgi:peptidoglycan/xylan/chitin deacetylase (PgdA/CDA1 family)
MGLPVHPAERIVIAMTCAEILRLDRMFTLCYAACYPRGKHYLQKAVPILMYHSVASDPRESGSPAYYGLTTTKEVFQRQMKYLHALHYKTLGIEEAYERMAGADTTCAEKAVVITFDDGFEDFMTAAFPILNRYGFTATVYLPTDYIHAERRAFSGRSCLRWNEVKALHAGGITFGSHTVSHPQLKQLGGKTIRYEMQQSKETIEGILGSRVTTFSYPYAFPEGNESFKAFLQDTLAECGYLNGVTTRIGMADRCNCRYLLPRLPVNTCDDMRLFRAKLDGYYNWMRCPQYFYKVLQNQLAPGESKWQLKYQL